MDKTETRGRPRKRDSEAARRGIFVQFERELISRVDNERNGQPRAAWIRQAIEDRLNRDDEITDRALRMIRQVKL